MLIIFPARLVPYTGTTDVYHIPLGRFSKVDCTTTKREDINTEQRVYASSEISRRDFATQSFLAPAPLIGVPAVDTSSMENRLRGVRYYSCHLHRLNRYVLLYSVYSVYCTQGGVILIVRLIYTVLPGMYCLYTVYCILCILYSGGVILLVWYTPSYQVYTVYYSCIVCILCTVLKGG